MNHLKTAFGKAWHIGGWAPITVFTVHVFLSRVLHAYQTWPQTDMPMHFLGGLAIAFFVSRCFQTLPRDAIRRSRVVVLEFILVGTMTATAAMLWEFSEFTIDQLFGTNIQVSLANTMQDMALGIAGAATLILFRAWQLRAGKAEITELTLDWIYFRNPYPERK